MKNKPFDIKFYFYLFCILFILFYPIYFLAKSFIRSYYLSNNSKTIKAIVIDEENYTGHSPVIHTFYYSYQFSVDDKIYKGNTGSNKFEIGDSVEIRYAIINPNFNEIIK